MMIKATVGSRSFQIEYRDEGIIIDGQLFPLDVVKIRENYYSIIHKNKSHIAEILKIELVPKLLLVRINGRRYEVHVKDKFDQLLEKMGINSVASGSLNSIKAPMPGLIIDMKIKEGDVVKKHDPLLVLEAMKMENIIKSPGEGTVKMVHVKKGESVEKNQVLVEF
jgi:acetyl/propionyl-CoA carboxylase alpha subunit